MLEPTTDDTMETESNEDVRKFLRSTNLASSQSRIIRHDLNFLLLFLKNIGSTWDICLEMVRIVEQLLPNDQNG
jgi:hypothetical protein